IGAVCFRCFAAARTARKTPRHCDRHPSRLRNRGSQVRPTGWPIPGWRCQRLWSKNPRRSKYRHKANSLRGNGQLSLAAPGEEQPDRYTYDPQDPVSTRGGTTLGLAMGVFDQTKVEEREDVLVYTGDALTADLEVTGPISLRLFAASSAPDTDFTAKLVDLRPDGYAQNIAEGVIRARFRESLSQPALITPEKVYEYTVDLWATSHVFKAGHRLRLEVSSSNFPRYDRNPNTGHDFGVDAELRTARQTIFHDSRYPSHLVLPVIPR
ncbi:MAG: CocE/NonD family hydrolase, partial [Deltaproteobacteria bacterium]|nr:CocE/NonD family hydrolase [Deltaproteobacteria bacterium]